MYDDALLTRTLQVYNVFGFFKGLQKTPKSKGFSSKINVQHTKIPRACPGDF